jgi:hypothetical protein
MVTQTKAIVTVAEMARMVGLSRARFYQLIGSAFPHPLYDVATRRPFYPEEQQQVCLEVRRRNCGVDGRPILFYARRFGPAPQAKPKIKEVNGTEQSELLDALKSLGLTNVTSAALKPLVRELYPNGIAGVEQTEVIRTVFLRLKRRDSGDNVGR